MRQKLHIARGLINNPEILFLDEPTIGLDPVSSLSIKDSLSHSALIFNLSLAPFIYAVVSMYLYQGLNDGNSTFYILLGAGAMGVWESTLMGGSWSLREEKEQGILEYYMCSFQSACSDIG